MAAISFNKAGNSIATREYDSLPRVQSGTSRNLHVLIYHVCIVEQCVSFYQMEVIVCLMPNSDGSTKSGDLWKFEWMHQNICLTDLSPTFSWMYEADVLSMHKEGKRQRFGVMHLKEENNPQIIFRNTSWKYMCLYRHHVLSLFIYIL